MTLPGPHPSPHEALRPTFFFFGSALAAGEFVCTYAGEPLSRGAAAARRAEEEARPEAGFYVLTAREILPSGRACVSFSIDPRKVGSLGRFINHSCCGGNLEARFIFIIILARRVIVPRLRLSAGGLIHPPPFFFARTHAPRRCWCAPPALCCPRFAFSPRAAFRRAPS